MSSREFCAPASTGNKRISSGRIVAFFVENAFCVPHDRAINTGRTEGVNLCFLQKIL